MLGTKQRYIPVGNGKCQVLDLHMWDIYCDVIEGVPDRFVNNRLIEEALEKARRWHGRGAHLVFTPPQTPLGRTGDKMALPRVSVAVRVRGPAKDPDAEYAEASLVWFQDEVTLDFSEAVQDALTRVQWVEVAEDVYW